MRRQITTIVAVAGLAIGPAAVASAQPSSPDARDANTQAQQALQPPYSSPDPRSPDARDAADLVVVPAGIVAKAPVALSAPSGGDGFDWGSAGIGAGSLVIAVVGLGALFAVRRARRTRAPLAH